METGLPDTDVRGLPATPQSPDGGFGERLLMARVIDYDYLQDQNGNLVKDDNGNPLPTGLLNIALVDHSGSLQKVPFLVPASGNSMFFGGLPERESLCIVFFRQRQRPVILGFLPMGLHRLSQDRASIDNPFPGELIVQASNTVPGTQGNNVFAGANVKWDIYGRVVVSTQNYQLIIGGALQSEYTPAVTHLTDPFTGNPIMIRELVASGALDRRIDNQGNVMIRSIRKLLLFFKDIIQIQTKQTVTVTATKGFTFANEQGSGVMVDNTGKVTLVAAKGAMEIRSYANLKEVASANKLMMVNGDLSETTNGNRNDSTVLDRNDSIGGNYHQVVNKDSNEEVTGKKTIKVTGDWDEQTQGNRVIDAQKIQIGGPSAVDALILGDKFMTALDTMINTLQQSITQLNTALTSLATAQTSNSTAWTALGSALSPVASVAAPAAAGGIAATAAITVAVPALAGAVAAIKAFQAQESTLKSQKHKVA